MRGFKLPVAAALLTVLCVAHVQCWIRDIGYGHKCRISTMSSQGHDRGAVANIDPTCTEGTIEWHYPSFDPDGLAISWTQGSRVCILSSSFVDLLQSSAIKGSGEEFDLSSLGGRSGGKDEKVCTDMEDGQLTLTFHSDVASYMQVIDYRVE